MTAALNVTDRELLELAAKAAGLPVPVPYGAYPTSGFLPDGTFFWRSGPDYREEERWNPLTNDGAAFRLAVKLNLSIITGWGFDGNPSGSVATMLGSNEDLRLTTVQHGDDPCAAWRRSIVLAAAEMGRAMP